MKFIPHEYQQYAIDFIESKPISAVFLDMGLGWQNSDNADGNNRPSL